MPDCLRWGIIGCGDVVEYKSLPSIKAAGRSMVTGVMRRNAAAARQFAAKHGIGFWSDRAETVINNPNVDIVYVATPPHAHREHVLAAAAARKHVLVEKPMALTAAAAQEMITACDQHGVQLFVAYYRRFQPHVLKMKDLLREGQLGTPVQARFDLAVDCRLAAADSWRLDPQIAGGGYFVDIGSHRLDLMVWLCGEPVEYYGVARTFQKECRVEQTVALCVQFKDGVQGLAAGDFYTGRTADLFEIIGTQGALRAAPLDGHAFDLQANGRTTECRFEPYPGPHTGLIRHVENVLLDQAQNRTSGRDALWTEKILDAVIRKRQVNSAGSAIHRHPNARIYSDAQSANKTAT